jgi:hypothetical protein
MTKPQATFEDCDQPLKFTQKSHDREKVVAKILWPFYRYLLAFPPFESSRKV